MGEMIKFGIKLAMTIATAVALVAAIALLYTAVSDAITSNQTNFVTTVTDIARIIQIYLPINVFLISSLVTTLGAFKVAYWAADKMIQFLEAAG